MSGPLGQEAWTCRARPARLGGKPCGHQNATSLVVNFAGQPMVCCSACGCTKRASDLRAQAEREAT